MTRRPVLRPTAAVTLVLLSLVAVLSACGAGVETVKTPARAATAKPPVTPKISPEVRRIGRAACAPLTSAQALRRYLTRAKAMQKRRPLAARAGLIVRATHLPEPQATGPAATTVAAALYALTRPRADRASAFQGCAAALRHHTFR